MNITKILAGLLIVVAIALAIMAWLVGRQPARPAIQPTAPAAAGQAAQPAAVQYSVVVASRPLAGGQHITDEDVKQIQVPAVVADSFTETGAVVGRTTLAAIATDQPIREQQLINGLALQIGVGQRAVSIALKEPMAAGHHVRPGDFVDVFFTLDGKNENTPVDTQARLLLARSRVLAYGSSSVDNPPPTAAQRKAQQEQDKDNGNRNGARGDQGARIEQAQTALLAVPLEDVERLTLAEKYGHLTLALRHPDDTSTPDPSLFAALPTVLQPVASRMQKGERLQGADRSFAGMRLKDLASGADSKNLHRGNAATPATTYASTRPAQPAPRPMVEIHQGAAVQTVSY